MDQRATQRQAEIRTLIDSDTLTLEQARAALHGLLDVTSSAQTGPDVTSYGIGGSLPREVVDAEYAARETVGDDLDDSLLRALRPVTAQHPNPEGETGVRSERLEELARVLLDSEDPAGRTLMADALARAYDGQGLKELRYEHAYLHEQNAAKVLRHLLKRSDALHVHTVVCVGCGRTATFEGGQIEGSKAARVFGWHDHEEALNDCGTLCPPCTAQCPGLHGFGS